MSDHLFDPDVYGEVRAPMITDADAPMVERWEPPWVLLANRHGVLGFHWPQAANEYSTTYALCGAKGHSVVPPETMVRCSECERLRLSP